MQTIVDQAISETLGSSSSSLTALQTTALIRKLDVINRDFVNAAHLSHMGGAWSWMQDVTNFSVVADSALDGAITTSSVAFTTESSGVLVSTGGRVWIKTANGAIDFVDYTSSSSATASGATDIDMSHADGEMVGKCYPLPSTYAKARSLVVNMAPYTYRAQSLLPYHATYYTRGAYIVLPEGTGSAEATLWFEKTPTNLSTGVPATDLAASLDIPTDFMWYAVHRLMAYILRTRRKRQDALESEQLAQIELDKAINYDTTSTTLQGLYTE